MWYDTGLYWPVTPTPSAPAMQNHPPLQLPQFQQQQQQQQQLQQQSQHLPVASVVIADSSQPQSSCTLDSQSYTLLLRLGEFKAVHWWHFGNHTMLDGSYTMVDNFTWIATQNGLYK